MLNCMQTIRRTLAIISVVALANVGGCATPPENFASADAAVNALVVALRADDTKQLNTILGSDADALLSSGDQVADSNGRAAFLALYDEKHALHQTDKDDPDSMTLDVGNTDWPMPIPIVKGDDGWFFDTEAGLDEILSRRIGRNELYTIQVCLAIVDAEREYAVKDYAGTGWREYAMKLRSDPGKKNGLYWETKPGEPESPMGDLVAEASEQGYNVGANPEPRPFHGYFYKLITSQGAAAPGGELDYMAQGHMIGGFAVVAWPAEYGNSGIKTFIVSHHGHVYEKDLGDDTASIARDMKTFDPGPGWEKCKTDEMP